MLVAIYSAYAAQAGIFSDLEKQEDAKSTLAALKEKADGYTPKCLLVKLCHSDYFLLVAPALYPFVALGCIVILLPVSVLCSWQLGKLF